MVNYKELPGIEYLADYSKRESEKCGFEVNWYICHCCNETFMYDYGKSQRHDPNFCPICGTPNDLKKATLEVKDFLAKYEADVIYKNVLQEEN